VTDIVTLIKKTVDSRSTKGKKLGLWRGGVLLFKKTEKIRGWRGMADKELRSLEGRNPSLKY